MVSDKQRGNNGHGESEIIAERGQLGGCTGRGFVPGVSGNPNGRPRGKTLSEYAREYLAAPAYAETPDRCRMMILVETLYGLAIGGDMRACKLLLDRVDPAPRWRVNQDAGDARERILEQLRSFAGRLSPDELV